MAALGEYLRTARERRGVDLDEVARVTRVRRQYLAALEDERFDLLPAAPFVRGFVIAYARYLGLPVSEALTRYQAAVAAAAAAAAPGGPAGPA
ncbi:MAG TPA: helix-turn-helix domain-containing protein, partial [Thermodesulfobacteriota bacterium]|nr:helix-turn-helix domain-containing protein [Thermodesulfobacteriota bacterium]